MYKTMPRIVRHSYAIPYEVFEIEDYQAKYYALMRFALARSVGMIATANPSSILKMCEKADEFGEQIIRDVRDGTLAADYSIDGRWRAALEHPSSPPQSRSSRGRGA